VSTGDHVTALRLRLILIVTFAALVLGVASTVVLAVAVGPRISSRSPFLSDATLPPAACATPALTGSVVDVTLTDMGGMMGPGMMGSGRYGPGAPNNGVSPWQNGSPWPGAGMMMQRIFVVPSSVPAGPVSLRVHNTGALTHEVMVLPLNPNQYPGQRAIGTNNQVDETGSLAEASRSCGADAGDGVLAGSTAWTTVNLPPGRYELLCNIAGHYGAGMYAELDAVGNR
jgi:Sulfocyanin (SoxE) domain